MKYTLLIFIFFVKFSFAQTTLQTKLDFTINNQPIAKALLEISTLADVDIAFSENYFDPNKKISLQLDNQTFDFILQSILQSTNIEYKFRDGQVILLQPALPKHTISGYIMDAETGERLISATIFCHQLSVGAVTNEHGFFSLRLPTGIHDLAVSYIGYNEKVLPINLTKNKRQHIELMPALMLEEVVVTPKMNQQIISFPMMEGDKILKNQLQNVPNLGGEPDIMRMVQMLPGINSGADGFGGISVRGGTPDQNLVLLDGVPLYKANHLLGQFSIFNANAVRSVKLLKGGFPARYGSRIASVLDVRTREGNRKRWGAETGIGMLSAHALIEGPFAKGKGAVFLAGRRTHSDFYLEPLIEKSFFNDNTDNVDYNFYDWNGKVNFDIGDNDRLQLSFYQGGDNFSGEFVEEDFEDLSKLNWTNRIISLEWNHIYNHQFFSSISVTNSRFISNYRRLEELTFNRFDTYLQDTVEVERLDFENIYSEIEDWTIKTDWDLILAKQHHLKFGFGLNYQTILSSTEFISEEDLEEEETIDFVNFFDSEFDLIDALNVHAYLEDNFKIGDNMQLNAGLRYSLFSTEDVLYQHIEPRINLVYHLNSQWNITATTTRMVQYLHPISDDNFRINGDFWTASDVGIEPQIAWQGTLGLQYNKASFSAGAEAYAKQSKNHYQNNFIESNDFFFPDSILNRRSYGIEFFVRQNFEKLGGWMNYTLSKSSQTYFGELDNETPERFTLPTTFDSRHQFKIFLYYKLSKQWTVSCHWMYNSSKPFINYNTISADFLLEELEATFQTINVDRRDPIHRLDFSLAYTLRQKKLEHDFKFNVYNVYNRKNVAFYIVDLLLINTSEDPIGESRAVSLMPILPSLYYNLRF